MLVRWFLTRMFAREMKLPLTAFRDSSNGIKKAIGDDTKFGITRESDRISGRLTISLKVSRRWFSVRVCNLPSSRIGTPIWSSVFLADGIINRRDIANCGIRWEWFGRT